MLRAAVQDQVDRRLLTVPVDSPAFVSHNRRLKRSGLLRRATGTGDPDPEHWVAVVIGPKDVVVAVHGEQLGLPAEMVWRQPFPGPGLGIRIIGEVTADRLDILREADAIARAELTRAGLDRDIWQMPVVLLADVRSVGVQGDGRTYGHPVVIRPVTSEDAMTADWARLPYEVMERISTRITNEVREVNRVVLDVTSKPPGTIEWE